MMLTSPDSRRCYLPERPPRSLQRNPIYIPGYVPQVNYDNYDDAGAEWRNAPAIMYTHVSLAWRHAVAIGIIDPLPGDTGTGAQMCLGRYRGAVGLPRHTAFNM